MMKTKDDGGSIFYLSEFLGDSLIKAAINGMASVEYIQERQYQE